MKKVFGLMILSMVALSVVYSQDSGFRIAEGVGGSFLVNAVAQRASLSALTTETNETAASWGANGFVDITPFFTVNFGYRGAVGDFSTQTGVSVAGNPAGASNTVSQFEIGGQIKYPFQLAQNFSLAPTAGVNWVGYLGGGIHGTSLSNLPNSSDWVQQFSPFYVTVGTDLNFNLSDHWFIRIPLDLGMALNAQLSSQYYSPESYSGSSNLSVRSGVEFGYSL